MAQISNSQAEILVIDDDCIIQLGLAEKVIKKPDKD